MNEIVACPFCGRTGPSNHIGSHKQSCVVDREGLMRVLRLRGFIHVGESGVCWTPVDPSICLPDHRVRIGGVRAHVLSYRVFIGPIPSGKVVCHSCDVANCANPDHLWIGTQADNIRDMWKKGRGVHAGWASRTHAPGV